MSSNILQNLEETFGEMPSYIQEHLKYFFFNPTNKEFQCAPCGKIVKTGSMNRNLTANNFSAHVFSKAHIKMSFTTDKLIEALSITFQGKIPQIVLNSIYVLDILEGDYKCFICDKILEVKSSPLTTENSFSYHLLSFGHKRRWEEYKVIEGELTNAFGGIPNEVINNKEFIRLTRSGKNYVCTVCNVFLSLDDFDLEEVTVSRFNGHFCSVEHERNIKLSKVFSLIPEMQTYDGKVQSYLMRNIDYITTNGNNYFCKLCYETIEYDETDISETEQNLKLHILSPYHENNLYSRLNHDHEVLGNLNIIIGEFTDIILKNLRYLKLTENCFICSICDAKLTPLAKSCEKIKNNITHHFNSACHRNNFAKEMKRRKRLISVLESCFCRIPPIIKKNLAFIEFKKRNNFQCSLCGAVLQTKYNDNAQYIARITEENFERHLSSSQHNKALANKDYMSNLMQTKLQNLFYLIPQFIVGNWDHIQYDGDNGCFICLLCNQNIFIDNGNKKEELTLQNFRTHIFSVGHINNLKTKANRQMKGTKKLMVIFGAIPNCILSNIEHLYENKNSVYCNACGVEIRYGSSLDNSKKNFYQHLTGTRHKSNVEYIEASIDNAFQFLDHNFCLPEFLLKEIDFLENSGDDLYCTLCQYTLTTENKNLKQIRQSLKYHFDSARHKFNLKYL